MMRPIEVSQLMHGHWTPPNISKILREYIKGLEKQIEDNCDHRVDSIGQTLCSICDAELPHSFHSGEDETEDTP